MSEHKSVSIFVSCPRPEDPTSYYRAMGPLTAMSRADQRVRLIFAGEVAWSSVSMADVMFLQRPFRQSDMDRITVAKNYGLKVWVDFDDDLLAVPVSNPTHQTYSTQDTMLSVINCLIRADVVTCSTDHLTEKMYQATRLALEANGDHAPVTLRKKFFTVRNALMTNLMPRQEFRLGKKDVLFWRGSSTHDEDLLSVGRSFEALQAINKNWIFYFQGYNPWFLTSRMDEKRTVVGPALDIAEYMQAIQKISPKVMVVPLSPNQFNLSKSNIAWIEGTLAGAVVVAPDWPEWRVPGVMGYDPNDPKSFETQVQVAMNLSEAEREQRVRLSFEHIMGNNLQGENRKRIEALRYALPDNDALRAMLS